MDPDLYETFVLILGDARDARSQLRRWATEVDGERRGSTETAGVSRLVHKKMFARIREVVEAGLTVIRKEAPQGGVSATKQSADTEWDSFEAVGTKKAGAGEKRSRKKLQPASPAEDAGPGLAVSDIDDAVDALADVLSTAVRPVEDLPIADGLPEQLEYTRERELDAADAAASQ